MENMNITFDSNKTKLRTLLRKFVHHRLEIPDHQRDFVWSKNQQQRLIQSIRRNKPIPSILLRLLDEDDERVSLEDGQQRLTTIRKFVDGEFASEGFLFSELPLSEQTRMLDYDVVTTSYRGTDEDAREIFNDHQNGKPLTFGERLGASLSPIVDFTKTQLLTPGQGYYDRVSRLFGEGRTIRGRRGSDMATAFALCAGLAFGIDHLSKKWNDAECVLHKTIDEVSLRLKLERYISIWERVHALAPITTKSRRNNYWDLGNFGGYIAYSMEIQGTADGTRYNVPVTEAALKEMWAQHIVACYRDETSDEAKSPGWIPLLTRVLHRDLSAARSWKLARWSNGLRCLLRPDNVVVMEDESDDDDASE